jgi:hypothetical protein
VPVSRPLPASRARISDSRRRGEQAVVVVAIAHRHGRRRRMAADRQRAEARVVVVAHQHQRSARAERGVERLLARPQRSIVAALDPQIARCCHLGEQPTHEPVGVGSGRCRPRLQQARCGLVRQRDGRAVGPRDAGLSDPVVTETVVGPRRRR